MSRTPASSPDDVGPELAAALARRLDAVAPRGVHVRSVGPHVVVVSRVGEDTASAAAEIVADADDRTREQRIETAARAVLDGVQDCVVRVCGTPWPSAASGSDLPLPDAEVRDGALWAWYGAAERPAVALAPVPLRELS